MFYVANIIGLFMKDVKIINKNGHYEAYDKYGKFIFSADSIKEAIENLELF